MKNRFEIIGNTAEILLNPRDGSVMKVIISKEDLEKAQEYTGTWCPGWQGFGYYVKGRIPHTNGKMLLLHRFLTNCPDGLVVDHINHNTLDNRKCNLKVCTQAENMRNRKSPFNNVYLETITKLKSNNTSGAVGVQCKHGLKRDTWLSQIMIRGKSIYLGTFREIGDAITARKKAEKLYYE